MAERFASRARRLAIRLESETSLAVHTPGAGMFALVNVGSTGLSGAAFAKQLLDQYGVAVMPGASFGRAISSWIRLSLTAPDDQLERAARQILAFCSDL